MDIAETEASTQKDVTMASSDAEQPPVKAFGFI